MAALNNLKLFLEFEPIVKLACDATDCKNNLANDYSDPIAVCNLKHIVIGQNAKCQSYEPINPSKKDET